MAIGIALYSFAARPHEIDFMKHSLAFLALASLSLNSHANILAVFRDENGSTRWQYVANTTASILIPTLVIVLIFLIRAHLRSMRSNRALTEIKATLEDRVVHRDRKSVV